MLGGLALLAGVSGLALWCGTWPGSEQAFQVVALLSLLVMFTMAWAVIRGYQVRFARLLETQDEVNRIFRFSADILALVDAKGGLRSLNPAWTQITGRPVALDGGMNLLDVVHPQDVHVLRAALASASAEPRQVETRLRRADGGAYAWVAWRMVRLPETGQHFAIGRDVTEDKAREAQLSQSQKMETIGQLAGGIAHDFNNLLTVIMGSLELLQRDLGGTDVKVRRRIDTAMAGGHRAAALTQRLLAFARRQPLAPEPVDPNRLVAGMSEMLERVLGEHIALHMICAPGLWRVMADGHQLESAILNLAVNARDAMPDGGQLTVETRNVSLDDASAAREADVAPGQYVLIAVTDTGTGMVPEVMARVFEPFFTTKPAGLGTGLGLAQVYGFTRQSQGHAQIHSGPGRGTVVRLYLPRLHMEVLPEAPPEPSLAPEDGQGRGETVLLVEDEEVVRLFAAEVLRDYGYNVIVAENAADALPVIESAQAVDLLFTDMVLNGKMSGRQLAALFAERRPGVPVLFTTGYMSGGALNLGRLEEGGEFLGKPFTALGLAQAIRQKLDGRGRRSQVQSGA